MKASEICERLRALGDPDIARLLRKFFKTGPGEYGEGDVFVGLKVPETRKLAKEYHDLSYREVIRLLRSPLHEARLLALLILVQAYRRGDPARQQLIYSLYLRNSARINNWDLVDVSAEHIVGAHLFNRSRSVLHELTLSELLWDRRIAIMATFHFIRRGDFAETLRIAERLLGDPEDLVHKAVGWMLREIGKRDRSVEEGFLVEHYRAMPRTMLRYAIEKFEEDLRQRYLRGEI